MTLPSKLSAGPDRIPPYFMKSCLYTISKPLHFLFNKSMTEHSFPKAWLSSYVLPIYKKCDRHDVKNYRPVSILSSIPKLFGKVLMPYLQWHCKGVFDSCQHGFVPQRSTTTNLLVYEQDILSALELSSQMDVIYTDYCKAFDKVNHSILLSKLEAMGFPTYLVEWLQGYLSNSVQIVRIHGFCSREIPARSGVPQGSHLRPLLFILFVIDLSRCFSYCKPLFFADELKIYL